MIKTYRKIQNTAPSQPNRMGLFRNNIVAIVLAIVLPLALQGPSIAADIEVQPPGYFLWSSDLVNSTADRLHQELGDKALVWETIGNYDGHSVYLVLRGRTSAPEVHETESDLQISVRGKAKSIVGGQLLEPRFLPRKQQRGSSIAGGVVEALSPGDIIHVLPGIPHQLIIEPGDTYTYLLIKIDEEPLN